MKKFDNWHLALLTAVLYLLVLNGIHDYLELKYQRAADSVFGQKTMYHIKK